ncbi:MAG: FtsQ-type POTRA domain-containing protein [Pseudomonadota bacterium]
MFFKRKSDKTPRKDARSPQPESPAASHDRRVKRRALIKSLLTAALAVDGLLLVLMAYVLFLHMPYFNLQRVDVAGNSHLSDVEVIEAGEIEWGTNLLTMNINTVAERLKRHPWIRSASVYRRLPGQLVIEIQERMPRAILAAEKLYYVDAQGDIFTRLLPGDPTNFPLFTGVTDQQVRARAGEVRELLRDGLGVLESLDKESSGLNASWIVEMRINPDEGLTLVTGGRRLILMGKGNYELKLQRYGRLKRFLTRRREWNNARIIDLDFEDRALVRTAGARLQG